MSCRWKCWILGRWSLSVAVSRTWGDRRMKRAHVPEFESAVEKALSQVVDPELGMNVVEAGMYKGATLEDGVATIEIALTISGCPLRNQIEDSVVAAVGSLPDVREVKVKMAEMAPEDRSKLMDRVRKRRHDNPEATEVPPDARVLAVASGKGGVGKSTVAANLATRLSLGGLTVGVLDADIWGYSLPRILGVKGRLGGREGKIEPQLVDLGKGLLKVVSTGLLVDRDDVALMWRGLVLSKALEQFLKDVRWGELDYLVVDLPPGTGDIPMTLARMLPGADVLVVTTPQSVAETVASRVANMARRLYLRLGGVVENMSHFVCEHGSTYRLFGEGGGERLAEALGVPLLGQIPIDPELLHAAEAGDLLWFESARSPAGAAIADLAATIRRSFPPRRDVSGCTVHSTGLELTPATRR